LSSRATGGGLDHWGFKKREGEDSGGGKKKRPFGEEKKGTSKTVRREGLECHEQKEFNSSKREVKGQIF